MSRQGRGNMYLNFLAFYRYSMRLEGVLLDMTQAILEARHIWESLSWCERELFDEPQRNLPWMLPIHSDSAIGKSN